MDDRTDLDQLSEGTMRRMGIPRMYRSYSAKRTLIQQRNEGEEQFIDRVKRERKPTIGVSKQQFYAIRSILEWTPRSGKSLFVTGPVGRGKSLLLCALAMHLAGKEVERRWVPFDEDVCRRMFRTPESREMAAKLGRDGGYHITPNWPTMYVPEDEFVARVQNSWSGDKDTLLKLTRVTVLILDDVGRTRWSGMPEAMEKLIDYRYRNGMPLIISSNIPFHLLEEGSEEVPGWGARAYSRLEEMMPESSRIYLRGPNWRNGEVETVPA